MKITSEIFESYLNCRYKGYQKFLGVKGKLSAFEIYSSETRQKDRELYLNKIRSDLSFSNILENFPISSRILKGGSDQLFNVSIVTSELSSQIDVIEKISTPSILGKFSYIPIIILPNYKVSKTDRLLLSFHSLVLGSVQKKQPEFGKIYHGNIQKPSKVKFEKLINETKIILSNIQKSFAKEGQLKVVLNKHCQICEFKDGCYKKAYKENNLSLLRSLKESEILKLNNRGIFTVLQYSYTFKPRRIRKKRIKRPITKHHHSLKALAIREEKVYIYNKPIIPREKVKIFVDVEGDPDRNLFYLIGIIIINGKSLEKHSYWINNETEREEKLINFLDTVGRFKKFRVFHFGSYEIKFFKSLLRSLKGKRTNTIRRILDRCINVLSIVYTSIYFPTYSNGLKEIAQYLGFQWSIKNASGLDCVIWRRKWEKTGENKFYKKLIVYNMEDCLALKKLTDFIFMIIDEDDQIDTEYASIKHSKNLYEELLRMDGGRYWRNKKSESENYDFINKRAYFDYQRNKIYVRSDKSLAKVSKRSNQYFGIKKAVNQGINIGKSIFCPKCKSTNINKGKTHMSKIVVDLKYFKGGIKRWITKYSANKHNCRDCGKFYIPKKYKNLKNKYGHNLISWVIYQNIVNGISFEKIEKTLADSFQISIGRVGSGNSYYFKTIFSEYYSKAYKRIVRSVPKWKILHVDETRVSIRGVNAYVWVFTNMTNVFFIFTETREADFLHDLIKNFNGVLISDFYKGYDSINCKQQKCLIHLIRDLNDALFKNQQDEELISITRNFSILLRTIVETIDRHGLKKKNLNKHKKDVEVFYKLVNNRSYESETSLKFIKRFKKYQGKLFTFLDYDGVPWNNNNAEHAFKHFATYRRDVNGMFSKKGLRKYLILLSMYETCKYRDINFLKFLLSKEKYIDRYLLKYTPSGNRRKISQHFNLN